MTGGIVITIQKADSSRKTLVERAARGILDTEGVPPFHENANEVIARTLDMESTSAELARSVMKDLGLVTQILRLANSALYNRSGKPILKVAHAVTLLGWETVRNLVTAVRYLEHYAGSSPGLRELMYLSLLSAAHGREIASVLGYPRPEEAYICGLFRNLGEVLVACHHPQDYSAIILSMYDDRISDRAACLRTLHYSYDELGTRIAEAWNLPRKVSACIGGQVASGSSAMDRCLISVASYSRDLTNALYRDGAAFDAVHLQPVLNSKGQKSIVSVRDLRRIIESAESETRQTMAAFQIPLNRLRLDQQAARASEILSSRPAFHPGDLEVLDHSVQAAARTLVEGNFELNDLIQSVLDAVCAAGFDRVIFGLVDESRTSILGRLASGEAPSDLPGRFALPLKSDCFQDVLAGRSDPEASVPSLNGFTPGAMCMLPIVLDGAVVGCLYADLRNTVTGIEVVRWPLSRARDVIARAIRRKASRKL